jgi:glutaredoxin 3
MVLEESQISKLIQENSVFVFSKSYCGYCARAKSVLTNHKINFKSLELDQENNGDEIQRELYKLTGQRTVPSIFIAGKHFGGSDYLSQLARDGSLFEILKNANIPFEK